MMNADSDSDVEFVRINPGNRSNNFPRQESRINRNVSSTIPNIQNGGEDARTEREISREIEKVANMNIASPSQSVLQDNSLEVKRLNLSSPEIKSLSPYRVKRKRLPDIVQDEQRRGINRIEHRLLFEEHNNQHSAQCPPIKVVNNIDNEFAPPFDYLCVDNNYLIAENLDPPPSNFVKVKSGCDCDFCDPRTCSCRKLHSELAPDYYRGFPENQFAYNKEGRLFDLIYGQIDTPIWECNSSCGCGPECQNRVVSKGRKVPIIIFKHEKKGWCVKVAQGVTAGQFIGIYTGELISAAEAEKRNGIYMHTNNTYVMDLTFFTIKWNVFVKEYLHHKGITKEEYIMQAKANQVASTSLITETEQDERERQLQLVDDLVDEAQDWYDRTFDKDPLLSIDGSLCGNFVRYIAHSCVPNLSRHMVYTYDRNLLRPFVAYFANKDLKAGDELTIDYGGGESLTETTDGDAKAKVSDVLGKIVCHCGMGKNCRGFVFARSGK